MGSPFHDLNKGERKMAEEFVTFEEKDVKVAEFLKFCERLDQFELTDVMFRLQQLKAFKWRQESGGYRG